MRTLSFIAGSILQGACGQLSTKQGMAELGLMSVNLPTLRHDVSKISSPPLVLFGLLLYVVSISFWRAVLSCANLSCPYPQINAGHIVVLVLPSLLLQARLCLLWTMGRACTGIGVTLVFQS